MVKLKYRELVKGHNRWVDILTFIFTVVLIPVSLGVTAFFIVSAGAFNDVPNAGVGIPYYVGLAVMGLGVILAYYMNCKLPVWFNRTKRCDTDYDPYEEMNDELRKKHEAKLKDYDKLFDDMKQNYENKFDDMNKKYELKSKEYDDLMCRYAQKVEETTQPEEITEPIEEPKSVFSIDTKTKIVEETEPKKTKKFKKQPKNKSKKTRKSSKSRDKKGKFVQVAEEEEETPDNFIKDMATAVC